MKNSVPIPSYAKIENWESVPILECGEPLVSLDEVNEPRICVFPAYYNKAIDGAVDGCYLRESVIRLLASAATDLPPGWQFVVYDGWRPLRVQKEIFNQYYAHLSETFPDMSTEELIVLARKFVSIPSDDCGKPSPHYTGGAIDIGIRDARGIDLDMGCFFDDFSQKAMSCFFELQFQQGTLLVEDHVKLVNRRILYSLLTGAGFTNYPEEWWHYDYGNQFWAKLNNSVAIYGGVRLEL